MTLTITFAHYIVGFLITTVSFFVCAPVVLIIEIKSVDAFNRWIIRLFLILLVLGAALYFALKFALLVGFAIMLGLVIALFGVPLWLLPKVLVLDEPTWSKLKELT